MTEQPTNLQEQIEFEREVEELEKKIRESEPRKTEIEKIVKAYKDQRITGEEGRELLVDTSSLPSEDILHSQDTSKEGEKIKLSKGHMTDIAKRINQLAGAAYSAIEEKKLLRELRRQILVDIANGVMSYKHGRDAFFGLPPSTPMKKK